MTDQAEVMAELLREAHAFYTQPRQVAAYIVKELERLRGSGQPWVSEQLAAFAVEGCMKRASAWRASQRTTVKTRRGKTADVPAWAGVQKRTEAGVEHHQLRFEDLTADQVADAVDRMSKARDTLSVDIAVRRQILEYMREHPSCTTAGEAMEALGIAA